MAKTAEKRRVPITQFFKTPCLPNAQAGMFAATKKAALFAFLFFIII